MRISPICSKLSEYSSPALWHAIPLPGRMWLRPATGRMGGMVASGDPRTYAMDALNVEFLLLHSAQNNSSVSITLCFPTYHFQVRNLPRLELAV